MKQDDRRKRRPVGMRDGPKIDRQLHYSMTENQQMKSQIEWANTQIGRFKERDVDTKRVEAELIWSVEEARPQPSLFSIAFQELQERIARL